MAEVKNNSNGISFMGFLTLLFVGLKLTNYIAWSWWWVLSPLWISVLVWIVIVVGIGLLAPKR
jgi:uncharacterized protein (DUF983 family)